MKSLKVLLAIALVAPLSLALADESGKTVTKRTDDAGTTVTTSKSHEDSVGKSGIKKSTEDVSTVVDPKGPMNKESAKMHSVSQVEPNGDYSESRTDTRADGTKEKVTAEKSTAKNWTNDGETATTNYAKSVDPKGLGNKETSEVKKTVESSHGGVETTTVTKQVNGDTVSEQTSVSKP